jgi:hypothetical protein
MSSIKEYLHDQEENRRDAWIREQIGDPEADELHKDWEFNALQWENTQSYTYDSLQTWYAEHSYTEIHTTFKEKFHKLNELLATKIAPECEETFFKMIFAHSVTLMETFLYDTVRSIIASDENYFRNAITGIDDLKKLKPSLVEIHNSPNGIKSIVNDHLATILYHNVPKVVEILSAVLEKRVVIDPAKIVDLVKQRHDIVHRDGKNADGSVLSIDKNDAENALKLIETFINDISKIIHELKEDQIPN